MQHLEWLNDDTGINRNLVKEIIQRSGRSKIENEINTLYLFLTRKCNLSCSHCYINGVGPKAKDQDFDLKKIKPIIYQALDLGLKKVKVSGGEPFVHKEISEILDFLNSLGLAEIVLETNGMLVSEIDFKKLKSIKNLTVFVSLDHINPKAHDDFRKKDGAFDKTVTFLKKLGASEIESVVTTTANKNNYKIIRDIIDFVIDSGIKKHRTLLNIHPIGNAAQNLGNALNIEECTKLMNDIIDSDHYKSKRAYLTVPPALTPLADLIEVKTCGWSDRVLGVLSTGEVSMCSASYDDKRMLAGSLYENSLEEIWKGAFFDELREIGNGKVKGVCGNCMFYEVCKGVCKMSSYSHYGEKDAPYPLCQEFYNRGFFPKYALTDPNQDCFYKSAALTSKPEKEEFPDNRFIDRLITSLNS